MSRLWVLLALLGWHHLVPRLFRLMNHQSKDIFTDYMISGNMHRLGHWVTSDGFSFDLYALMFLFMNIMWLVNRICTILMAISIRYSNVFFDFGSIFPFSVHHLGRTRSSFFHQSFGWNNKIGRSWPIAPSVLSWELDNWYPPWN